MGSSIDQQIFGTVLGPPKMAIELTKSTTQRGPPFFMEHVFVLHTQNLQRKTLEIPRKSQEKTPDAPRIWWKFRRTLDRYLDVAEDEVKSFQRSIEELSTLLLVVF